MSATGNVCAVVVTYYPDEGFIDRLANLMPQVSALVVVDNTPAEARRQSIKFPTILGKKSLLIENSENLGVGSALNQGLKQASAWHCDWLLTLDQDSHCYADMVQTLLHIAAISSSSPVVIGGNYLDPRNGMTKVALEGVGEYLDQKTVITSGSLVNVRFSEMIGRFREDYFIDQLDHEFCLRVRMHGGSVVISRKPAMKHSVGETGGAWVPFLGRLSNHPPLRKYYIARNSLVTIAKYWRSEPAWCMRRAVRLMLGLLLIATLESERMVKIRAFAAGITDAMCNRMGPCRRTWLLSRSVGE